MNYSVSVKEMPDQNVVTVRRKVSIAELEGYIHESIRRLSDYVSAQGVQISGAPMAIYHEEVNDQSNGLVEVCVPLSGDVAPAQGIQTSKLAATQVAYTTTTLSQSEFPQILDAYGAVHAWIKRNDLRAIAPPREIYLERPGATNPDDPFIEIAWPIA